MWSYQGGFNLHICHPPIRNKHLPPPSRGAEGGDSGWFNHSWFELKRTVETGCNDASWMQMAVLRAYTPSHTLERLLLNMEHSKSENRLMVAQHTGRKSSGGTIYAETLCPQGDQFRRKRWECRWLMANGLETILSLPWY